MDLQRADVGFHQLTLRVNQFQAYGWGGAIPLSSQMSGSDCLMPFKRLLFSQRLMGLTEPVEQPRRHVVSTTLRHF